MRCLDLLEHERRGQRQAQWIVNPNGSFDVILDVGTASTFPLQISRNDRNDDPVASPCDVDSFRKLWDGQALFGAVDELAPYPSGFPRSLVRDGVDPGASRHLGLHRDPVVQCVDRPVPEGPRIPNRTHAQMRLTR